MSDSTDFDEFEDFDFEDFDIDLEQLETEEVVEKRRENRMLSMKDRINAMKNLTSPETGRAQIQEDQQETTSEPATTQTQSAVSKDEESTHKGQDEAISIDTDSLETLQKKWENFF